MDFQQMGKKTHAGRFELLPEGNHRKSYQLDFAQTRKAAEDLFLEVPIIIPRFRQKTKKKKQKQEEFSESCLIPARMELGETGWS